MIDKLCKQYGVTVNDATTPQVLEEDYLTTGRMNDAEFMLFCAVARFYDAKGYVYTSRSTGRKLSTFKCIGTEAQQIQTKLYYEFLLETMQKECKTALQGEKLMAELQGYEFNTAGFKPNFNKAFAEKVGERLREMKEERGDHEHKEVTAIEVAKKKFGSVKIGGASGAGAAIGSNAGANASLYRQTSGSKTLALCGS